MAQLRNDGLNIATRLVATNVGDAVHALREGGCDLMLAFYDPDAALQMDAEIFPSLHMGTTEMLPVCAVDADGKPLFDLEGEGSVPLLAYTMRRVPRPLGQLAAAPAQPAVYHRL